MVLVGEMGEVVGKRTLRIRRKDNNVRELRDIILDDFRRCVLGCPEG